MKRPLGTTRFMAASVLAVLIVLGALSATELFDYDVWTREHRLVSPTEVTSVRDGTITLADGRAFRPAGVRRSKDVTSQDFDKALRVIVAQGVFVTRDLGDGSATLVAEPKFYNWCGTRGADGIPWKRNAGWYLPCPVSELLIQTAYAIPDLDQPGLTPKERWRIEGVEHLGAMDDAPTRIFDELNALRFGGHAIYLDNYDATLELMWKAPPSP